MHLKDADTKYSSILDGFRKILKSEGVAGLYKGIESKIVQSVTTAALMFMFKEQFYRIATLILRLLQRK
jgi:solute carrier family 25 (peroxisomal adenine nucleotide transporter), member 17